MKIDNGKLYIKKRTFPEWAVLLVLFLPFTFALFVEFLKVPGLVKYVVDFLLIALIALFFIRRPFVISKKLAPFLVLSIIFLIYTFAVYLFNFESPFYYIWGVRNNFRFYVAFIAFAIYINKEDAVGFLDILDILFWANAIISFVQFFMGYNQDFLGGIFGVQKGCNGYSVIFLSIIVIRSMLSFMNGTESTLRCFAKCATALLIGALAELKFLFVIFILILIMASIITSFSWRKFILIFVASIFVMIGSALLVTIFGFEDFLTIENVWQVATQDNYANAEDMNRFSAIPTISNRFLTDIPSRLFGMGLGNCDTATISVFNTEFYQNYVDLHYSVFSVSFLFLETGFIGLTMFVLFFVFCFIYSVRMLKSKTGNLLFNQMAIIMSVLSIILMFYNSSLRTEAGYMVYFVLALPFVANKGSNKTDLLVNELSA